MICAPRLRRLSDRSSSRCTKARTRSMRYDALSRPNFFLFLAFGGSTMLACWTVVIHLR
jgi:hypothetical protein